jgi:hypothetical protein
VHDHPRLRQRKGNEDAQRVERQHRLLRAFEDDDEHSSEEREHDDAVGEHKSVALIGELAREVSVSRNQTAQPREVCERGVRREHEDGGGGGLNDVVDDARAESVADH